ncbi:MFS transporter [Candidatus Thorarchaeota archaeon]|nr:MAG: MFS transporter [Candidatus Thorarchaeota archaeon]
MMANEDSSSTRPELDRPDSLKPFASMWSGQAFSLFGSRLVRFVIVWWLTLETGSATVLAIASIAAIAPQIIITPFAGSLVDRWDRRRVMITADSLTAVLTGSLALLFYLDSFVLTGIVEVWHMYAVILLGSVLGSFHWPAMQASTTMLVPEEQLSRVGGMNQALNGLANVLAPPVAAVLFAFLPMHQLLLVDVITAVIAVSSLAFIRIPTPPRETMEEDSTPIRDMVEGFRFLRGWPGALLILALAMILNLVSTPAFSLVPILSTVHFGGDELTLALLQSASSLGMVLGGILLTVWGGPKRKMRLALMALVVEGIGSIFIGLTPPDFLYFAVGMLFMIGLMIPIFNGLIFALLQTAIPADMQGRVFALIVSGASAMSPIGLAVAGPFADAFGVPLWFLISGIVTAVLSAAVMFVPATQNLEARANERMNSKDRSAPESESKAQFAALE